MSDQEPDDEAPPPAPPRGFNAAAFGLVIFTACRLLEIFLEAQATASAVGQAVLVEWGTSRLGVVWTPPDRKAGPKDTIRRGAVGVGIGFTIAALLVVVLVASNGAKLESVGEYSAAVIVIGLVSAGLHAWRDELLLHGVTLRALGMFEKNERPTSRPPSADRDNTGSKTLPSQDIFRVVACGVTSAGAALGRSDASARTIIVAMILGIAFGALWVRDRGAWMPWGAHTAFRFATDTLIAGGFVQVRLASNGWSGGDAGVFGGTAAVVALLPVAIAAIVMTMRGISPDRARVG